MAHIHDLIKQVRASNSALGDEIAREVEVLAQRRAFGLNFERHTPEAVELPGRRVRVGDRVRILPPRGETPKAENDRLWRVVSISGQGDGRVAQLEADRAGADAEHASAAVSDLVFVSEFRDPIYPGLVSTGKVERGGDKPFHSVINAENYHALQALLYTHRGAVDAIYIDPPYNTGNDGWVYNDRYVASDDMYRHSKWLAFMERRLMLAKDLLAMTGVIIVAIGDEEHHRLRMLMDQVFGAQNFISDVVWQGGRKNDSRYVSNGADYMLIYARDESVLSSREIRWREEKEGVETILEAGRVAWSEAAGDQAEAELLMRRWFAELPRESALRSFSRNVYFLPDGTLCSDTGMQSPNPRRNLQYDVAHPVTGAPAARHENGWRYERTTMARLLAEDRVIWRSDPAVPPRLKKPLEGVSGQVFTSVFERQRTHASRHLQKVLGDRRFPFPKDHEVLMRWLRLVAPDDAVVLDFFGGSGTTAESVMRANESDGGSRRCILVTNNELAAADSKRLLRAGFRPGDEQWQERGVFEHVAVPRITTVVTGERADGSVYSDGLAQNVEFFTLTYEAPMRVQSHREFAKIAPLLWLRAGSRGRRIEALPDGWDVAETYGVIDDIDKTDAFVEAMAANPAAKLAFIVTDEDRFFEAIAHALPDDVEAVRLYDSYLRNFEIDAMRGVR